MAVRRIATRANRHGWPYCPAARSAAGEPRFRGGVGRTGRGRHRFRLLVHAPRSTDVQAYLRDWLAAAPTPRGSLRVQVDIDPQSFL